MYIKEWVDFVIYPLNPNYISNAQERLNIEGAFTDEKILASLEPQKRKYRVTKNLIFFEESESNFEAMTIDKYGNIIIWTKSKIWFLQRFGGAEKLQYVPRHPLII